MFHRFPTTKSSNSTLTLTYFQDTKKREVLLNIFENNFYIVIKKGFNGKRHYILPVCNLTCHNLC